MRSVVNKTKITDKYPNRACSWKRLYWNHLSLFFFFLRDYATRLLGLHSSSSQLHSTFESAISLEVESHFFFNDSFLDIKGKFQLEQRHLFPSISSPSNRRSSMLPWFFYVQDWWMTLFATSSLLRYDLTNVRDEAESSINNISSARIILFRIDVSVPIYLLRFLLYEHRKSVCPSIISMMRSIKRQIEDWRWRNK